MSSTPAASPSLDPVFLLTHPLSHPPTSRTTTVPGTSSVGEYNLVLGQKNEEMQLFPGPDARPRVIRNALAHPAPVPSADSEAYPQSSTHFVKGYARKVKKNLLVSIYVPRRRG